MAALDALRLNDSPRPRVRFGAGKLFREVESEADCDDGGGESWPDARYSVTKLNNLRENFHTRPQGRVLALAADGVRHVKVAGGSDVVRRFHPWGDVAATYLLGADRLCVSYYNDVDYQSSALRRLPRAYRAIAGYVGT
jgi:hypothetical protein